MVNLQETFEKHNDVEYIKFERVTNPKHPCPDICAFLMLHEVAPKTENDGSVGDMVTSAEHDAIYLNTDLETLAENATEDQIITLIRCGVMYDNKTDSLMMFV